MHSRNKPQSITLSLNVADKRSVPSFVTAAERPGRRCCAVLLGAQLFALYEQSHGGLDLGNAGQRVVALSDDKAQLGQTASATVLKGPQAQVST